MRSIYRLLASWPCSIHVQELRLLSAQKTVVVIDVVTDWFGHPWNAVRVWESPEPQQD